MHHEERGGTQMPPLFFWKSRRYPAKHRGAFYPKWKYLPGTRQNLPHPGKTCRGTSAARHKRPGVIFRSGEKSMFKQI
jgi:hypothetical protein